MNRQKKHHWSALLDQTTHRMEMCYHPVIGHLHVPGIVARLPHERGGYLVRTNSAGFRSDVEFVPKKGERPRILVLGDSFTAGQGCDNVERYSDLIAEALDAEVYNLGLSGSGPDQQLLIYEELGKRYEADLIVWGIALHNIERIKMHYRPTRDRISGRMLLMPKPYFTLDDGALRIHHVPVPKGRPDLPDEHAQQYQDERHDRSLIQRMFTGSVLSGVRRLVRKPLSGAKHHLRAAAYRLGGVQIYDDYLDQESEGWKLMAAIIRRLKDVAGTTPLLVVPLPTFHYYVDRLEPIYDELFGTLTDDDKGLVSYGLTADLVRGKTLAERLRICFENDTHYAPYGHREVARLLSAKIMEIGVLPQSQSNAKRPARAASAWKGLRVVGVSVGGSDGAAVLVGEDGVLAASREAAFAGNFETTGEPLAAINYCLEEGGLDPSDLAGLCSSGVEVDLNPYGAVGYLGVVEETPAGLARCAGAFLPSPFEKAAIVVESNGQVTLGVGEGDEIRVLEGEGSSPAGVGDDQLAHWVELVRGFRDSSGQDCLCLSGVSFLDPQTFQAIQSRSGFAKIWAHAATGGANEALGAALLGLGHHSARQGGVRLGVPSGPLELGPGFSDAEIEAFLSTHDLPADRLTAEERAGRLADHLGSGSVVANFLGRYPFGTAAAGGRAVLADANNPVSSGRVMDRGPGASRVSLEDGRHDFEPILAALEVVRPGSQLLVAPLALSQYPVALTPYDAYRCLMRSDIDFLVAGSFLIEKARQPAWPDRSI